MTWFAYADLLFETLGHQASLAENSSDLEYPDGEEGRTKNENRLLAWVTGAGGFLFSFFYFRSCPWFPSPRGEREKNAYSRNFGTELHQLRHP
jgi:hypothetical protein